MKNTCLHSIYNLWSKLTLSIIVSSVGVINWLRFGNSQLKVFTPLSLLRKVILRYFTEFERAKVQNCMNLVFLVDMQAYDFNY